jgi:hypothetical protein
MKNKVLLAVASTLEAVTGIALIIAPTMVLGFLLGTDISSKALIIPRIAGFGLLSLGLACWPRVEAIAPRLRAMLIYNLLATTYLGYLWFRSKSVGKLLMPAVVVHAALAILFVGSLIQICQRSEPGKGSWT